MGLQFHVETDHKPLVPLPSGKRLDEFPIRVQRFCMRMMQYTFSISHVPGKSLVMADTLSRAPSLGASKEESFLSEEAEAYVHAVFECLPATERRLEEICQHQKKDSFAKCHKILPVRMARAARHTRVSKAILLGSGRADC